MATRFTAVILSVWILAVLLASSGVVAVRPVKCPIHNPADPVCISVDACIQQCGNEGYHFGLCSDGKCVCFNCHSWLDAKLVDGDLTH
ncbi:hypothetical protein ZWY2020_019243 [Hordeum vulgare]|nr:hypothetical protein ZWY2020_019243 [Hordeum vulgare]